MLRIFLPVALLIGLTNVACSQDKTEKKDPPATPAAEKKPAKSGAELVKADPNSDVAWSAYAQEKLGDIGELIENDPKAALARLKEVKAFLKSNPATERDAEAMLERFSDNLDQLMLTAEVAPQSVAKLAADFDANQGDAQALLRYRAKLEIELSPLVFGDPEKAADLVKTAKQLFQKAAAHSSDKSTERNLIKALQFLKGQEAQIEAGRQIQELEGKDAAPLVVDAWIKGKTSDAELKGKVILLDFWAIWCGPCVASFPELQKWQKEYGGKGLEIVGVTKYYGFNYDAENDAIIPPAQREATPAEERAALTKFAEHHKLTHHLAVVKDDDLNDYYRAKALPHMALIGRDGKIVKSFVGGGKGVSSKVDAELKKLLGDAKQTSAK